MIEQLRGEALGKNTLPRASPSRCHNNIAKALSTLKKSGLTQSSLMLERAFARAVKAGGEAQTEKHADIHAVERSGIATGKRKCSWFCSAPLV